MADSHGNGMERLAREKRTIQAMMQVYCRAHHASSDSLCDQCPSLYEYALCRLDRCPFGAEKTTCARCPIHCYKPATRAQIKAVMRYAGRRLLFRHPVLALLHLLDTFRRPVKDSGHAI
jgi:hypothetical protein